MVQQDRPSVICPYALIQLKREEKGIKLWSHLLYVCCDEYKGKEK